MIDGASQKVYSTNKYVDFGRIWDWTKISDSKIPLLDMNDYFRFRMKSASAGWSSSTIVGPITIDPIESALSTYKQEYERYGSTCGYILGIYECWYQGQGSLLKVHVIRETIYWQ